MSKTDEMLGKLRRFLRDPEGLIWDTDTLLAYWNEAQTEIAQKTLLLVKVESHYYPSQYTYAYCYDWEKEFVEGDAYQPFPLATHADSVVTYPWEGGFSDLANLLPDDGHRITQPWEAFYVTPADVVPTILPNQTIGFDLVAYERERLEPVNQKELAENDRFYRTTAGLPVNYWRPSAYENALILYPRPSTAVWQKTQAYTGLYDDGGLKQASDILYGRETGRVTDEIESTDALFLVYKALPHDWVSWHDEKMNDWPDWFLKFVMYATLERAFGADSDGFIPTLRDYWKLRKEIGLKMLAIYRLNKMRDKDIRLGGDNRVPMGRGGRFPEGYPAI